MAGFTRLEKGMLSDVPKMLNVCARWVGGAHRQELTSKEIQDTLLGIATFANELLSGGLPEDREAGETWLRKQLETLDEDERN